MTVERLAERLLADRNRSRARESRAIPCFACGRSMIYRGPKLDGSSGRFCGDLCRDAFDGGFVVGGSGRDAYRQIVGPSPGYMPRAGLAVVCPGCSRTFASNGLRCCSTGCQQRHRERLANRADMLDEPAAKRQCEAGCGRTIPRWRNGRAVGSNTRFCSPGCARRARRAASVQAGPDGR